MATPISSREPKRWDLVAGAAAILAALHILPKFVEAPAIAENRELATLPPRPNTQADWWALPKKLDEYVQDRFPPRPHLIAGLNQVRMLLGDSGSSRVIIGRAGWLFYDDGSHLGTARAAVPLTAPEVARWVRTLRARKQLLNQQGAAYVVLLAPVKERVYPEYAPRWMRDGGAAVDAEKLLAGSQAAGLHVVTYLLPALRNARTAQEPIYTPYDIHWTGLGAYRGYVELANALTRQGVTVPVWPLDRYTRVDTPDNLPRDVALMLGVADFVKQEFPRYEYPPVSRALKTQYLSDRHDWTGPRVVETGQAGKPVLMMTGDSFSNELLPFLYPHFSRLILAHDQDGFFRQDLIETYRPDAVVLEVLGSGARHAMGPPLEPTDDIDAALPAGQVTGVAAAPVPTWTVADDVALARWSEPAPGTCNLEIAERADRPAKTGMRLEGWMFDYSQRRSARATIALLTDAAGHAWTASLANDVPRPDVAAHFGVSAGAKGGFSAELALPKESKPPYTVRIGQEYDAAFLGCGVSAKVR